MIQHVCTDVAAESENRVEIYLEDRLPVGLWELVGGMSLLDAAAIEQNVDFVTVFEDGGDEGVDGFGRGEIAGIDLGFAAESFDGLFGGLVGRVPLDWG